MEHEGWITCDGVFSPARDAAHVHLGGGWRMPTKDELGALKNNCDWIWTSNNGANGYIVRGRGDYALSSIFLPAAGYGHDTSLSNVDSEGRYWASGQSPGGNGARYLFFNLIDRNMGGSSIRDYGLNIRPVYGLAK